MAGVYGEINSRQDFFRVLGEAIRAAKALLARDPQNDTIETIDTELDAIQRWTAQGAKPTKADRDSIDMGLRASRELEPATDKDVYEFVQKIYALQSYIEDWPSDDKAASATDDDFWDDEEDDDEDDE